MEQDNKLRVVGFCERCHDHIIIEPFKDRAEFEEYYKQHGFYCSEQCEKATEKEA